MTSCNCRIGTTDLSDAVNHPAHYTQGKYEFLDVAEDWGLNFHLGNALKYICRHRFKGKPLEDLKKAKTYLDRYIAMLEKGDDKP